MYDKNTPIGPRRDRVFSTDYANDPEFLQQQPEMQTAKAHENGTRPREDTVYSNNPEYLKDLAPQQGAQPPARSNTPPARPPRVNRGTVVIPRVEGDPQGMQPPQSNGVAPANAQKPINIQVTGKFISHFGKGYDYKEQGLIFKPSGDSGALFHFSPAQAKQLRASNEELILESIRNGQQGQDVQVSLSNDGQDRATWKVKALDQQQRQSNKRR